jgi:hypothetical protein
MLLELNISKELVGLIAVVGALVEHCLELVYTESVFK